MSPKDARQFITLSYKMENKQKHMKLAMKGERIYEW